MTAVTVANAARLRLHHRPVDLTQCKCQCNDVGLAKQPPHQSPRPSPPRHPPSPRLRPRILTESQSPARARPLDPAGLCQCGATSGGDSAVAPAGGRRAAEGPRGLRHWHGDDRVRGRRRRRPARAAAAAAARTLGP